MVFNIKFEIFQYIMLYLYNLVPIFRKMVHFLVLLFEFLTSFLKWTSIFSYYLFKKIKGLPDN
jgi:hypothetical protein